MDTRTVEKKIELEKKLNPALKKIHKYQGSLNFFNNKFEIYSLDPQISSSYIFDSCDNAYELNKLLGKGAFGVVKIGFLLKTGRKVAIKIQNITSQIEYHSKTISDRDQARIYVMRQIEIEDRLLKLTGLFLSSTSRINLKNQEKHYSIMEYIEGNPLKDIFSRLSPHKKIQCFIDLTKQIQFLHSNNYLHLDIWRENILYNNKAILHDYGCSAELTNEKFISKLKGSHIPPEIIDSHKKQEPCIYGTFSDVYALGMTFYELFYDDFYNYTLDQTLDDFTKRYSEYHINVIKLLNIKNDPLSQTINKMITISFNERLLTFKILSCLNFLKESMLTTPENNTILPQMQKKFK